jgi:hypothetical protein
LGKGAKKNMIKLSILIAVIAVLLLLVPCQLPISAYSPRHCKGLDIYFYTSDALAFTDLAQDKIDFMDYPLTSAQYISACNNPNLQLAGYAENGIYEFDLNNNYTIPDFPDIRNPLNDVEFRRAIAEAVVKPVITNPSVTIECPLAAPHQGYGNATCCNPSAPPYPGGTVAANARLDAAGFDDYDSDGWRNYPLDWDGVAGVIGLRDEPNIVSLTVCVRSDHPDRLAAGTALVGTLTGSLGIPVSAVSGNSDILCPIVMNYRNYHIYTGSWSVGRYPTYLYAMFHSDNWFPGGSNYVTGMNASNEPNYPDLDAALEEVRYATDMMEFTAAVKKATGLLVCKYCVNIPLWSYKSWVAYSKYLVGIVNMDGYGLENTFTFLNAYKVDNPDTPKDESQEPIRVGTINAPSSLNILYSTDDVAKAFFDKISGHLLSVNPYNLAFDQPWIAQDWQETTWYDQQDGEYKTKVTYWIRKDVWWHAPVTGEAVQQFTAHDVAASIWYIYPHTTVWNWPSVADVHHTVLVDDFTIEVYFDSLSMFHKYAIGLEMPLLKKHMLIDQDLQICVPEMCEFPITEPIAPSDKTILPCGSFVQIINATKYPEGGTTTADGNFSGTTVIDTTRTENDGYFVGMTLKITSGACSGQTRRIINWVQSNGTFTVSPNFTAQIVSNVTYIVYMPLVEGVDYEIFGTMEPDYTHNKIHWLRALAPDETIVFWYYTPNAASPPAGFYLCGLPWQQTMYSLGPYYVIDIVPGVGGNATMNCVDSHFIGAPPLGEIDWMWYWNTGPYPRTGYYQVNLYDAVALLKAYGTRGNICPISPDWNPGADIDPYDLSYVYLYDAVMLLTKYGRKFGIPP